MDFLGRGILEGQVKGTHLSLILIYLQRTKTEAMKKTLAKLALVCGMQTRYIRENYLEGLQYFGIIDVKAIKNDIIWNWIGQKAINGLEESFMDWVKHKKREENKKRKKKNEKVKEKNGA